MEVMKVNGKASLPKRMMCCFLAMALLVGGINAEALCGFKVPEANAAKSYSQITHPYWTTDKNIKIHAQDIGNNKEKWSKSKGDILYYGTYDATTTGKGIPWRMCLGADWGTYTVLNLDCDSTFFVSKYDDTKWTDGDKADSLRDVEQILVALDADSNKQYFPMSSIERALMVKRPIRWNTAGSYLPSTLSLFNGGKYKVPKWTYAQYYNSHETYFRLVQFDDLNSYYADQDSLKKKTATGKYWVNGTVVCDSLKKWYIECNESDENWIVCFMDEGKSADVSPGCKLDLEDESVIFASIAPNNKSLKTASSEQLKQPGTTTSNSKAWKLTLKDTSKKVDVSNVSYDASTRIISTDYSYEGNDVTQLSVVITNGDINDSSNDVLYYGAMSTDGSKQGIGTFKLPEGLPDNYKMYVLAEDVNNNDVTDYASEPKELKIGTCKVEFDSKGGSEVRSQNLAIGDKVKQPNTPEKRGYKFAGWFTDEEYQNEYKFDQAISESDGKGFKLYAKWELIKYHITYQLDGFVNDEKNPDTYTVEDRIILSDPKTMRTDLEFGGWYLDGQEPSKAVKNFTIERGTIGDLVLHVRFDAKSGGGTGGGDIKEPDTDVTINTVSFESNGGSNVQSQTVLTNQTLEDEPVPDKDGLTFAGWYREAECVNEYDFSNPVTSNFKLYAKWNAKVDFVSNGGTPAPQEQAVDVGTTVDQPSGMEKLGFAFKGWYDNKEFSGNQFNFSTTAATKNTTLYAKWELDGYAIKYNGIEDGDVNPNPEGYYSDTETIVLKDPSREGYTFLGWTTDGITTLSKGASIPKGSSGTKTFTANWKANESDVVTPTNLTVKFNSNGGSSISNKTVANGTVVTAPNNPTKKGYTFGGWYLDSALRIAYNFNNAVTQDTTLYAKWTVQRVSVYRLVNNFTGEHFYTTDAKETAALKAQKKNWTYEGVGWVSPATSKTSVHRFSNKFTGEHFFSVDKAEIAALKKNSGYVYEGIAWYASDTKTNKPINRFLNKVTGEHFFTADSSEIAALKKNKYFANEGVAWYGLDS